jgi:Zn-dependent protease/predicted transcriptional regulator
MAFWITLHMKAKKGHGIDVVVFIKLFRSNYARDLMSLQIGKIKGISIKLHFTLIIVFFLVTWTLSTNFMPFYYPNLNTLQYWLMGIIGAIILIISVLIHEHSHSIVAKRYGIRVKQIVLFIFGGVSDIEEEPKDFKKEFKMAFAGPATSFILSGIFAFLWYITTTMMLTSYYEIHSLYRDILLVSNGIFYYATILNLVLGIFNLIPAFPMDGGRILRSILIRNNKDYDKSTRIAVKAGVIISYIFFAIGIFSIISGGFVGGIWVLIIGWFLNNGAQTYLYQYDFMRILSGIRLKDIMTTDIISVPMDISIEHLLKNYFSVFMKSGFPVVDNENRLVGLITLKDALSTDESNRDKKHVYDNMIDKNNIITMDLTNTADKALTEMIKKQLDKIFICDDEFRPLGVVSKTDIIESANERKKFKKQMANTSKT